ncbi:MAG: hypothetical protein OEY49_16845 [Candidatus Heimdallarchaeota archaeon]|nr:hypothetical protein [Candidatus Heimdallarchaeota archaeon]
MDRSEQVNQRKKDRYKDAIKMGLRSRQFSSTELLYQAEELINFSLKLSKVTSKKVND